MTKGKINHTSRTLFYPMKGEQPKTTESYPQKNSAERERYVGAYFDWDSWRQTRRSATIVRQDVRVNPTSLQP